MIFSVGTGLGSSCECFTGTVERSFLEFSFWDDEYPVESGVVLCSRIPKSGSSDFLKIFFTSLSLLLLQFRFH